ncbi:MAG: hypothetical protein ACXAE3_08025 [Candidatus Kariarchaeaceae archaeon]|jgi:hypothetical protein
MSRSGRVIHPGTAIILIGLAVALYLYLAGPYLFRIQVNNRDLRTLIYLFLAFPIPLLITGAIAGRRYGQPHYDKIREDVIVIIFCLAVVMLYAIVQASPGDLLPVLLKGGLFVLLLVVIVYGSINQAYTRAQIPEVR